MNKAESENASIHETTGSVVPQKLGGKSGDDEAHKDDKTEIIPVLPSNDFVLTEVANVGHARFPPRLQKHPAHVRVPETLVGIIRI